jgi:hypothetical protein
MRDVLSPGGQPGRLAVRVMRNSQLISSAVVSATGNLYGLKPSEAFAGLDEDAGT